MKIAKKKKHPANKLPTEQIIRMTNYMNLAIFVTSLWETAVLDDKELKSDYVKKVVTAYKIYLEEMVDKRQTINGSIEACKALTGFDVIDIVDEVFGGKLL